MRLTVGGPALALALAVATPRDARAVEGGTPDSATVHAVVVATGGPTNPSLRCSGVLVSTNVVLTARHCFSRVPDEGAPCARSFGSPNASPRDLWVAARPDLTPGTHWKNVVSWEVPETDALCGDDIAALVLDTPFDSSEATPARPVVDASELVEVAKRRQFGMAGYGATSRNGDDAGQRRSRFDIPIRCLPGVPGFLCDGALEYIDPNEMTGGAGPCSGDSGGGAIADGDRAVVFGVLSRGSVGDETCSEGIFERTDVWRWLVAKSVVRATPPGAIAPAWAREALPASPKLGDMCLGPGTCESDAECASLDGRRSYVCARRCDRGCGSDQHCEGAVCVAGRASVDDSGCSSAARPPSGIVAIELAALLGLWLRRRRRARR